MAPRYLIIGASGFVGRLLFSVLGPHRAVATFHSRPVEHGIFFDAGRMRLADTVLKNWRGLTHAFILHGVTNIDACARDPEGTGRVNVAGTRRVIDELFENGITPVFASSDAVFDGSRGLWTEEDSVNPILTYGRQKVAVEQHLLGATSPALVLRLGKVIATEPGGNDLLGDWISRLEHGVTIQCAHDQMLTPVTVDDAVTAFIQLAEGEHAGLFHVCGPRPVSRLDLLGALVEEMARYRELAPRIETCSLRDLKNLQEPRPLDCSMSARKLYAALGRPFEDYRDTCRRIAAARYAKIDIAPGTVHVHAR